MTNLAALSLQSGHVSMQEQGVAGVWHLTLERPESKNALNVAMYADMAAAISAFVHDASGRVLVLSGAGGDFCSGNDLADFAAAGQGELLGEDSSLWRFLVALRDCPKPVVVAVEGVAVGVGTTLLLHVDGVFARPDASLSMPFIKLGLCPEYGSSLLLPMRVGAVKAQQWLMLGESFSGEQALAAGLIDELADAPLAAALQRAVQLASLPPKALAVTKKLLRAPYAQQLEDVMKEEADYFRQALQGEEFATAVAKFFAQK